MTVASEVPSPQPWYIAIQAWLIQDRQYPEIARNDAVEFTVLFGYRDLRTAAQHVKTARQINANAYDVTGRAICHSSRLLVVDCGILIVSYQPPAQRHTWISGHVFLNVDESRFEEKTANDSASGMPGLYEWRVKRLWRETVSDHVSPEGSDLRARFYTPMPATDARIGGIDPLSAYLLECFPLRRIS